MKIVAQDALRSPNPYTTQLYASLQDLGAEVFDLRKPPVAPAPNVIHVHWPEHLFGQHGRVLSMVRFHATRIYLRVCLLRGARLVYTVHNLSPHAGSRYGYEKPMLDLVLKRAHGWISLSQAASDEIVEAFPQLAARPHKVIPHGHYRGLYLDDVTREAARQELGIEPGKKVALLFGLIKGYKGAQELAEAFSKLSDDYMLLIAGKAENESQAKAMASHNVRVFPHFVAKEKVQVYFRAADLAIMPFRKILNSGSALLALSFDLPILAPALGSLIDLRDRVGTEAVRLYEGEINPELISTNLDAAHNNPRGAIDLTQFDWPVVAHATMDFYKSLGA